MADTLDALIVKLGDAISSGEGGYESYNTGTKGVQGNKVGHSYIHPPVGTVTGKTINQILATDPLSGYNPESMFATGRYQTVIRTLRDAKVSMGLSGDELYSAEMQERVFREFLLKKAGGGILYNFIFRKIGTIENAQYAAAKEWASIAVPEGYANKYGVVADDGKHKWLSYYQATGQNAASEKATTKFVETLSRIAALP